MASFACLRHEVVLDGFHESSHLVVDSKSAGKGKGCDDGKEGLHRLLRLFI